VVLPGEVRAEIQERVLVAIDRSPFSVVLAPTGSGKSRIAAHRKELLKDVLRVVHVLPLRSLVEDLISDLACTLGTEAVGYQAGIKSIALVKENTSCRLLDPLEAERIEEQVVLVDHDPYMLHPYTVTTYDSYAVSFMLAPLPEVSYSKYGHPDLSFALLAGGLSIFDEIHLLAPDLEPKGSNLGEGSKAWGFIAASTKLISEVEGRVLYATATLSPQLLKVLTDAIGLNPRIVLASSTWIKEAFEKQFRGDLIEFINVERLAGSIIEEYVKVLSSRVVSEEPMEVVERLCKEEKHGRILTVLNTVERAVAAYEGVARTCTERGYEVVLVHGRMSQLHRAAVTSRIRSNEGRMVIVATQVVEAGVDLDADALVTDVAPLDSLIQRAGRVLRHKIESREGEIVISASREAVEACKRIYGIDCSDLGAALRRLTERCSGHVDWRYGTEGGCSAYSSLLQPIDAMLLNDLHGSVVDHKNKILELFTYSAFGWNVDEVSRKVDEAYGGSLIRDALRVPIAVKYRDRDDVAEVPLWYALGLAEKGYLEPPQLLICSERECKQVGLYISPQDFIKHLSQFPLQYMRRLVKSAREQWGREVSVEIMGLRYKGAYDEVRGFA